MLVWPLLRLQGLLVGLLSIGRQLSVSEARRNLHGARAWLARWHVTGTWHAGRLHVHSSAELCDDLLLSRT